MLETAPAPCCPACRAPLPVGWTAAACPRCLVHFSVEAVDPAQQFPAEVPLELGDHELIEEIARGGMGVVYRARQRRLGRVVAVKVLAAGEFASAEARRRFRAEAEAAARLQHPGIVAIHDVGETDGVPWLSMDFVPGENLAALVRTQPLEARQAADYVRAIAEAVQHAHEHGVLHRDLKPSNVLLDPEAGPRLTDFGIARCAEADARTRTGELLGSPGYAAPEQALVGHADARTDVYGLGALLYHLLTARPPFQGPTLDAILLQLRDAEPIAPRRLNPAVPRDLETICLACLRKDPARRYASARDVAAELARFQRGEPIHARPISALGKTWRWCRRRPALATALALLGLVLLAAFALVDLARRDEADAKARAESVSTQLAEALDAAEIDRAEDLFRVGDSGEALALLTRVIRRTPTHPIASARLGSALWHGDFVMLRPPPFSVGGKVRRLQFLRDGRTLLVGSTAGISTWDAAVGRRLREFSPGDGGFEFVRLSADESTLAAWDTHPGKRLHLYDVATGHLLVPPIPCVSWRHTVAFSPDGTRLIAATSGPATQLHDVRRGEPIGVPLEHGMGQWDACFSPDGKMLATTAARTVRLWSSETQQLRQALSLPHEAHQVRFSPDGRWLLATCHDGTMRFFSAADGTPVGGTMRHESFIHTIDFSPDGERLLTASHDHTARLWAVPGGEPLTPPLRHRDAVRFAGFSPDGSRVVTCASDHVARVWESATGRAQTQPLRHVEQPLAAAFTPDGATLYTSGSDGVVLRWDLRPAKSVRAPVTAFRPPSRVSDRVHGAFRITYDEKSRSTLFIDARTGATIGTPTKPDNWITDAETSPDGALVATASTEHEGRVWDAANGRAVSPPLWHRRTVSAIAWSPDGRRVATASWDGTACIWDPRTGAPLAHPLVHGDHVNDVQFSPDGRRVATASRDGTVRLWDATSGRPLTESLEHPAPVAEVRFEPGGERVVARAESATRAWEVPHFTAPAPPWVLELAAIIAQTDLPRDLETAGALLNRYERMRAAANATTGDDAYARLARHLFARKEKN